jgi:hypothetical protein
MQTKNEKKFIVVDGEFTRSFGPGTYTEEKDDKGNIIQRKIRATFATDNPVDVYDWQTDDYIRECLPMDAVEMPESRQVPLLDNHSRWEGSASVRGSCRNLEDMKNGTAEADVYFSSLANTEATLAREGHLTDLSVGYKTDKNKTVWVEPGQRATVNGKEYDNTNSQKRLAIRTWWKPFEISTTPIGADARTKFRDLQHNLNERETAMPETNTAVAQQPAPSPMDAENVRKIKEASAAEAIEAFTARCDEIDEACRSLNVNIDFAKDMKKDSKISATEAIRRITTEAQRLMKVAPQGAPNIGVNADETDKFREAVTTALCLRNGLPENKIGQESIKKLEGSEYRNIDSPQKVAKICLEKSGMRGVSWMDAVQVATEIVNLSGRASVSQGTGDFPYILAAAVNKFLMNGYQEAETTYQYWTGRQPLNDFKQNKLVNLSPFSDLDLMPEGENYRWGKYTDKGEYAQLVKFGKAFVLSFEALVNDDKNAFSRIPGAIGLASARIKDRCAYNYLIRGNILGTGSGVVGPTMNEDSLAMFHSTHANIGTTAAPSTTSLTDARTLLRKIKVLAPDATSKTIYTQNKIKTVLAAEAKWGEWSKVLESPAAYLAADGSTQQANPNVINPFKGQGINLVTSPYIDEISSTLWYAFADAAILPNIVLCTLSGMEAPQLRSAPTEIGMARGIAWDLMDIFVFANADWRGAIKNTGA